MREPILAIVLGVSLPAAAFADRTPQPAWFTHVPPAEAPEGEPVVVEARVDRAWQSEIEIRFRAIGDATWRAETFQRGQEEGRYRATVPALVVHAPGFEYFIVGLGKDQTPRAHFASAEEPHQVMVYEDAATVLRKQELERVQGRRARARTAFEVVDFGSRVDAMGMTTNDYYYRLDVDFTYRVLRFPLYSLRFGYTRLSGEVPNPDAPGDRESGFKVGGWFELRLRLGSLVETDGRFIVAATRERFNVGARFEGRVGSELGTHVALGWEGVVDTGNDVWLRLGWDTVPRFPMAATVSVTDMPDPARAAAVRLIYDVAYPLDNGLKVGARVGYEARDRRVGGVSGGLNLSLDF